MPALTLKQWACLIAVVLAMVGEGWWTFKVWSDARAVIVTADARVAAAKEVKDAQVTGDILEAVSKATVAYESARLVAPAPGPGLVCQSAAPRASRVRADDGAARPGDAATPDPEPAAPRFDPTVQVLSDGRDADAQIALLQAYVKACQDAGRCAKK